MGILARNRAINNSAEMRNAGTSGECREGVQGGALASYQMGREEKLITSILTDCVAVR